MGGTSDERLFQTGLFNLCAGLRASRTGSCDPMPDKERREIHAYLVRRVSTWKPSTIAGEGVADTLARQYIIAILREDGAQI